jgi:hypothetical protein
VEEGVGRGPEGERKKEMTHEFTHNPVKVHVLDANLEGNLVVFVGNIPKDVKKELDMIDGKAITSIKLDRGWPAIKKFYGPEWKVALGLLGDVKKGGAVEGEGNEISNVALDINLEFDENNFEQNLVTDDDLKQIDMPNIDVDNADQSSGVKMETKKGTIRFIYESIYPIDKIIEMKYKLFYFLNIPIFRQHLWIKTGKTATQVMKYEVSIAKQSYRPNIENFLSNWKTATDDANNRIEGIPVNKFFYDNKDFILINALESMTLLENVYYKYGTNTYYLIDMYEILPLSLLKTISSDKTQLELIYYGFIIYYFPMITRSVLNDLIRSSDQLSQMYPDLMPGKTYIESIMKKESLLLGEAYGAISDEKSTIADKIYSSIVETTISVDYHHSIDLVIDLRNIFDLLKLSPIITYAKLYLMMGNEKIIIRKSYMNEKEPKDIVTINSLMIKIKINPDKNENLRLILYKNGNYIVRTDWREENHMTFDKIIDVVSGKINPIIEQINSGGSSIQYLNVRVPLLSRTNSNFTETSIVFYYDDDLSEKKYAIIEEIIKDMVAARFLYNKEYTNYGVAEYFFSKGMYNYDTSRIEKNIHQLNNYYEYLSNAAVMQKWEKIFVKTRIFQVSLVSSKVKMYISGIRDEVEMENFNLILMGLLAIYEKNIVGLEADTAAGMLQKSKKALKNLKVQDPLLYEFKKIYKSNVVYSKICQKPYQPIILNEHEYKNLPADKKNRAVKYWNFTKQKPVWYSCPNARFPHIKFIVKQHPRDFCIPCCKKIEMGENVNIKKQEIHNTCLKNYEYKGEKISLTKYSTYIATYGKPLDVGRISRLPEHTLEPLFFDTYSPEGGISQECLRDDGYYILGVDQHLGELRYVGLLWCAVHSLNMALDDFLVECNKRIKSQPEHFPILLDGDISIYFKTLDDLCNAISEIGSGGSGGAGSGGSGVFITNKIKEIPWNDIFQSIVYYYFGVNVIEFYDTNKEQIYLKLPKGLKNIEDMFPDTHKNLIIIKFRNYYYPIYLLNTEIYNKSGLIDTRLFLNESGLTTIIKAVVRKYMEKENESGIRLKIDLSVIKQFCSKTQHSLVGYFINKMNLCYAVLVETGDGHRVYFPIEASHYSIHKDIEMIFEPYSVKYETSYEVAHSLFKKYNAFVDKISELKGLVDVSVYPQVGVEKWIEVDDEIIGWISRDVYFYCKPMSRTMGLKYYEAPISKILYHPAIINQLIYKKMSKRVERLQNDINIMHDDVQYQLYDFYLYKLILLHFISVFNKHKNIGVRKKLLGLVTKTNFDKNTKELREYIDGLILEDQYKIKTAILAYVNEHHNKKLLVEEIMSGYYEFDRQEIHRLSSMSQEDAKKYLTKIASGFIVYGDIRSVRGFKFSNIFNDCIKGDIKEITEKGDGKNKPIAVGYCRAGRLIADKKRVDEIISILAHDITSAEKKRIIFNSLFVDKTRDFYKFIRRPGETITVEFV